MSQTEVQLIKDAVIVNADVSNSAAIDVSKISGALPAAGGTITGDVTFDGATTGRDIVFDQSDDAFEFNDDAQIRIGTGNDLTIFHESSSNFNVFRQNNALSTKWLAGSDTVARFMTNGAVELYYDNVKKIETNSDGGQIFSTLEIGNTAAPFLIESTTSGNGQEDIGRIGINRTNSSTSDRQMWLQYTVGASASQAAFQARSADDTGTAGTFLKIDAVNNNVDLPRDNEKLQLGAGNDLQLYHNGTRSEIINNTGDLIIQTSANNELMLRAQTGESHFVGYHNAQVELYYDGSKKFETLTDGAKVTGKLTLIGDTGLNIEATSTGTAGQLTIIGVNNSDQVSAITRIKSVSTDSSSAATATTFSNRNSSNTVNEHMRIDSIGRVGIGTTSPVGSNAVFGGTQNTLFVAGSAAPMVRIASDTSNQADLILQAGNSGADAVIANAASNGDIVFSLNQSGTQGTKLRFRHTGGICFGTDDALANALDDYEEGTFNGTATAAGYSGGNAIALTSENYTKIGRTVHFNCVLTVASSLSDADLTLSGLPFSTAQDSVVDFSWQDSASFAGGQGKISGTQCVRFGGTFPSHHTGNANIIFSGTYRTAA